MTKEKASADCIRVQCVKLVDDDFFTRKRLAEWTIFISKCCLEICEGLVAEVDSKYQVSYFVSEALIHEVVGDAVVGMTKIINKTPHPIEHPNAFKIASYLGYWFLRNKPISVIYPATTNLDKLEVAPDIQMDANNLSWQLKHINEVVAVNIVTAFIFDFDKELCSEKQCQAIKSGNMCEGESAFSFDSFTHQKKILMQKLTYYFTYRAIAPKVIEHMLEGYAFHPAWALTGPHWKTNMPVLDIYMVEDSSNGQGE